MKELSDLQTYRSPWVTPQMLAWDGEKLWLSSRDLGTLGELNSDLNSIVGELDPPGVVWAGIRTNDGWRFTIGKGLNDDRFVYRYDDTKGFEKLFACPDFAGSYLSYDGNHLYLSQWYEKHILQLDENGKTIRELKIGEEICGHTFAQDMLYVIRGWEHKDTPGKSEEWRLARLDPKAANPTPEDVAVVPFAARSLTYDGKRFWSNHRAANELVSFVVN